ncbi:hypothetical protein CSB20_04290 [bacterium DOLZORAL124_64_63]|nr:MAG: hypothetical protein CSB20_04290 [bacterium DOLZORAL124_64_63]
MSSLLSAYRAALRRCAPVRLSGRVTRVTGLVVEADGPAMPVGGICRIQNASGTESAAEVVGFQDGRTLLMPLEELRGIAPGARVTAHEDGPAVAVSTRLQGRILDGLGNPLDSGPALGASSRYPVYAPAVEALQRRPVRDIMDLGICAINGLLTAGRGQRMGIFSGSGVGKSVLMGMIARHAGADVNVVALVGERGRELNEFIHRNLGEEGLRRSVVVVATSDKPPLIRMRAAFTATAIAEFFRDQGANVLLMMDSLTRFAMARREIGLSAGEPPTAKGYTPSVFALLPQLLERAGAGPDNGSGDITGLYTVLVEGDDMNEPVADAVRGIIDGHIVLSRSLAMRNHYPAIDVPASVSRVMKDLVPAGHGRLAGRFKEVLTDWRGAEDLINIGAYVAGSNPAIDRAIRLRGPMNAYLRQDIPERVDFEAAAARLAEIFASEPEEDRAALPADPGI